MRVPKTRSIQAGIPKGTTLRIRDGAGCTVRVLGGRAWVAEGLRTDDTILDAGDSFHLDGAGLALVFAYADARVEIAARGESPLPAIQRGGGQREILWMTFCATFAHALTCARKARTPGAVCDGR